MQYEQGTEKVLMTSAPTTKSNDDRQLRRTRKILLIVFGIFLVNLLLFSLIQVRFWIFQGLSIFSLAMLLMSVSTTTYGIANNYTLQFVQSILSIALYSFAYYVTHNYHPIGLRVVCFNCKLKLAFIDCVDR